MPGDKEQKHKQYHTVEMPPWGSSSDANAAGIGAGAATTSAAGSATRFSATQKNGYGTLIKADGPPAGSSALTLLRQMRRPYSDSVRRSIAYTSVIARLVSLFGGFFLSRSTLLNANNTLIPLQRYAAIQGFNLVCGSDESLSIGSRGSFAGATPGSSLFITSLLCLAAVAAYAGLTNLFRAALWLRNRICLEPTILLALSLAQIFLVENFGLSPATRTYMGFDFLQGVIENAIGVGVATHQLISGTARPQHGWPGYKSGQALEGTVNGDFIMTQSEYDEASAWGEEWNPEGACLLHNLPDDLESWVSTFNETRVAIIAGLCFLLPALISIFTKFLTIPSQAPLAEQEASGTSATMDHSVPVATSSASMFTSAKTSETSDSPDIGSDTNKQTSAHLNAQPQ